MRYDLHIHSKYSPDGRLEIEEIIEIALRQGLDGIAITDHNTIRGGTLAERLKVPDLEIICGCEFATDHGEVIGLFLTEEIDGSNRTEEVIDAIKDQGGIVIVPHPFDRFRKGIDPSRFRDRIDAIEAINARCVLDRFNREAAAFGRREEIATVGGSDAHAGFEIGCAWTSFEGDDLRRAITRSETRASGKRSCAIGHLLSFSVKLLKKIRY
ncbi:metal-dependent phosphoesterase [Methanosarcinales archaeon]|uniref:Metal-dependent phosphoesterase n=1 Tax=Candidatus Syntropharchaeum caldarium TaxID=1838285 RepID=A0A1F2PDB9_9EURY|nr:MAG: metal-dependent phosphoesterase [Candidatus Syntrophoarchaeum caldarius]RLG35479.1 MAG: metal-dependent phosphoesterase [Methanosarcinales archaeon]